MVRTFVTVPKTVEAIQYNGLNTDEIIAWTKGAATLRAIIADTNWIAYQLVLCTEKGTSVIAEGDFIVRDKTGEFYLCETEIFNASYAPVLA